MGVLAPLAGVGESQSTPGMITSSEYLPYFHRTSALRRAVVQLVQHLIGVVLKGIEQRIQVVSLQSRPIRLRVLAIGQLRKHER
jgi:hypothetical protein